MKQSELTHFDARGQAHMVDVGAKAHTKRIAVARGSICVNQLAYDKVLSGSGKKAMCWPWRVLLPFRHQNRPVN